MKDKITITMRRDQWIFVRGLLIAEAQRLDHLKYQRRSDEPSRLRRLRDVALKIYNALYPITNDS